MFRGCEGSASFRITSVVQKPFTDDSYYRLWSFTSVLPNKTVISVTYKADNFPISDETSVKKRNISGN